MAIVNNAALHLHLQQQQQLSFSNTDSVHHRCFVFPPSPILSFHTASISLPKDDPTNPRGEDSHFISAATRTVGVADGVGGWRKLGIDGGEYARELMRNSLLAVRQNPTIPPKRVLEEAYATTAAPGSSTACVVSLSGGNNLLRAANVGDSGFLVVRGGTVFYRSTRQQRSFNCPYQLGPTKDCPAVAEEIEVRAESGDVVVVGTDGLFDNAHEWEILEIVGRGKTRGESLEDQCCYMAKLALHNSFDRYTDSPFSIESRRAGKSHKGGKVDDITVIMVSII